MKNVLLIAVSFFVFSGCCTKKECTFMESNKISFNGFDSFDLSEIEFKTYSKPGGILIDSQWTKAIRENGLNVLYNPNKYYSNKETYYYLFIKKLNRTFVIDNIEYKNVELNCNHCFRKEYSEKLVTYKVNNITYNYDATNGFEIKK